MSFIRRLFGADQPSDNLRIIITRHGERADLAIGKKWLQQVQQNGNHDPRISHLANRPHFRDWNYDPPLTVDGENQSAHVGRKLSQLGYKIDYCYSSPSYRCVQTATKILESQRRKAVPINIEPGLFECPSWYSGKPILFIPPQYIAADKRFNVNVGYAPMYTSVDTREDERSYYRRSGHLIREIIRAHKRQGGTILLSGHAGSIEAVTRGLRGLLHRRAQPEHLIHEALRVNYCNFAILERDSRTHEWTVRTPQSYATPYGAELSNQNEIPLYALSTEHFGQQPVARHRSRRHHNRNHLRQ